MTVFNFSINNHITEVEALPKDKIFPYRAKFQEVDTSISSFSKRRLQENNINITIKDWIKNRVQSSINVLDFSTELDKKTINKKWRLYTVLTRICFVAALVGICAIASPLLLSLPLSFLPYWLIGSIGLVLPSQLLFIQVCSKRDEFKKLKTIHSKKFQNFIDEYLVRKNNFFVKKNDLLDDDLHNIFRVKLTFDEKLKKNNSSKQ